MFIYVSNKGTEIEQQLKRELPRVHRMESLQKYRVISSACLDGACMHVQFSLECPVNASAVRVAGGTPIDRVPER
jgi:hypothetical protein